MKSEDNINNLNLIIGRSRRIVFFGGAGISTACGIPDFRSAEGLYSMKRNDPGNDITGCCGAIECLNRSPEEILSAAFFALHTEYFYEFYRKHMVYPEARPGVVHRYLYELEKANKLRGIVTQNIDGLHKMAGNKRVYELHGSIYENYCIDCETFYPLEVIMESEGIPRCPKCGGIIKPWVVLYGEAPDKYTMIGAMREISGADTLIIAGTSLAVEPAASLIEYFSGSNLVIINRDPTPADAKATLIIREDIEETFRMLGI